MAPPALAPCGAAEAREANAAAAGGPREAGEGGGSRPGCVRALLARAALWLPCMSHPRSHAACRAPSRSARGGRQLAPPEMIA